MTSINAAEFTRFAAKLKASDKSVRTRVRRRLREVGREFAPEIIAEGAQTMPGSLPEHIKEKGSRPLVSQTATGVRLVLGKNAGPQIGRLNEGGLRHPTYGRPPWVEQSVPAGTWTKALEKRLPVIRDAVAQEVNKIMGELG